MSGFHILTAIVTTDAAEEIEQNGYVKYANDIVNDLN
jgi:hypothetical protein